MRTLFTIILLAAFSRADDPKPGTVIIRPNQPPVNAPAAPSTPAPSPDKPGTIIIRPQAPGTTPRAIETPAAPIRPSTTPTAPAAKPAYPTTTPVPVQDPKPVPAPGSTTAAPAAADANGKIVHEAWDIAFIKGMKVGHFHAIVREHVRDGKTYFYGVKEQEITVGRFGTKVTTRAEDSTLESADGTVLSVRMSQEISSGQKLALTGTVEKELLRIRGEGMAAAAQSIPWPDGVIGIRREMNIYKDKKPKPGDTFDYNVWEGRVNQVVNIKVKCVSQETTSLVEGQAPRAMLKFESQMEKIQGFQLPAATTWVDAETFEPLRTDQDLPSLGGRLILIRTIRAVALQPVGQVPDLFDVQSIKLDREIPNVHDMASVTYSVDLKSDPEPASAFARSDRQLVTMTGPEKKQVEMKTLHHLHVTPPKGTEKPLDDKEKVPFLSKSFFIDWDNDITKKQAAQAIAALPMGAKDSDKVKAIERWVNQNIRAVEFSQAMAPTSEVSKTLRGDCTEYSMLATGLCRANGIPSRTALGLVYAPGTSGKPVLAYHMWFEAYVDNRWQAFDGTLGRGGIGPGHVKISDSHWDKENSFTPLLPVLRVLIAQPEFKVAAVEAK